MDIQEVDITGEAGDIKAAAIRYEQWKSAVFMSIILRAAIIFWRYFWRLFQGQSGRIPKQRIFGYSDFPETAVFPQKGLGI